MMGMWLYCGLLVNLMGMSCCGGLRGYLVLVSRRCGFFLCCLVSSME